MDRRKKIKEFLGFVWDGDSPQANAVVEWLINQPRQVLGGKTLLEISDEEFDNFLGRLEHGVFS